MMFKKFRSEKVDTTNISKNKALFNKLWYNHLVTTLQLLKIKFGVLENIGSHLISSCPTYPSTHPTPKKPHEIK